jgi:hypothetical protein
MAKKSKKIKIENIVSSIIQTVVGVAIFLMLLLPNVVAVYKGAITGTSYTNYDGFQAFFAKDLEDTGATVGGIILLCLLIALIVLPLLKLLFKQKVGMLLDFVILGVSVVAAVFFFLATTGLMNVYADTTLSISIGGNSLADYNYQLGIGAILGAVFSLVDAGYVVVNRFVLTK